MSIRSNVISRLTGNRDLTSSELAELDSLAAALDLNENDPYWAQVAWVWAVTPRQEWIDVAHRALAAEIRNDLKDQMPQPPLAVWQDGEQLAALKKAIDELAARPPIKPTSLDTVEIKKAVSEILAAQKKVTISSDVFFNAIKDAAKETISWLLVAGAAGVIGLCLFSGMEFGEWMQSSKIQQLEQQVGDLTAALAKK